MSVINLIKLSIRDFIRNKRLQFWRYKLRNKELTIMANNCNGTFIYHDLNLKFNSPTINLFMSIKDFIKFMGNLDYYLKQELKEYKDNSVDYPVGILRDIRIDFMHYKTFNQIYL